MQYSKLRRNSFVHKYIYVVFLFQVYANHPCKVISVFTVQPLQSISIYKQAATSSQEFQDPCTWFMQNNSVFTLQALQSTPISTPLHVYKQAATSSQEFQDPCTWFMQNNSVFTVQALQSVSISLHVYKQAATGSQEFQDPCTWFMQNNSVFTVQPLQ